MLESAPDSEEHLFKVQWSSPEGGFSEGPLTLLWSLIESYKVDIFEVSLSKITEDFIRFIQLAKNLPIELSSEYAKMAASLVYLKSKALLPNPGFEEAEDEPSLPKELVEKLLEFKKYQIAGTRLGSMDSIQAAVFKRESSQILIDFPEDENWLDLDLIQLISAFNSLLSRQIGEEAKPSLLLAESDYSIQDKIRHIEDLLAFKKEILFSEIFEKEDIEVLDIVYSFLALLEIVKIKPVKIQQHKMFGDIRIVLIDQNS